MATKKKLLFINGHLNTGGVEKSLVDVLQHLDYDRYEVDLLLTESLGDYASTVPEQVNVILKSIENTYGAFFKCILRCIMKHDWFSLKMRLIFLAQKFFGIQCISMAKKMLTKGKHYDCVIGYRRGLCTQIAAFAVNADFRISWWHHGSVNVDASYLKEVENCQKIAVVSNACKEMLIEAFPSLEAKLVTVPNMVNPKWIAQKAVAFDPYSDKNLFHIVSVGGLVPEKHFDNAICTARKLKDRGISFQWHLVGDGVLRRELENKVRKMDVADCFLFEGNQANPYPYMKHADLFVHPSYVESHGIVVLEALALGMPCVVTKSLGPCEFIVDEINGVLTERNTEDLFNKVELLITDQVFRNKIKRNSSCPTEFTPIQVMCQIDRLLEA